MNRPANATMEYHGAREPGVRTSDVLITSLQAEVMALRELNQRKDDFLAVLAHELRNPMAPLQAAVELLGEDSDRATVRFTQAIMARQMNQLVGLLEDLLDLNRVNRNTLVLPKEAIELRSAVETALESAEPLIHERGHHITVTFPEEELTVLAPRARVVQIFNNLITNAAKYTDKGGLINVAMEHMDTNAVITVSDNGIGIDPADHPKLFGLFTQFKSGTDRSRGGLGIGLYIVNRVVHLLGGSISMASEGVGKGTTFTVTLPLMATADHGIQAPHEATRLKMHRILIVDDNEDAAMLLRILLEKMGHTVRSCNNGVDALEEVQDFKPELVLMDIGMPGMDGFEVCRRIRALPGKGPARLVALTGWGQEQDRAKCFEAGFDEHLVKPADQASIVHLIEALPVPV